MVALMKQDSYPVSRGHPYTVLGVWALARTLDSRWLRVTLPRRRLCDFVHGATGWERTAGEEGGLVFVEAPDFGLHEVEPGLFGRQFGFVWFC